MKTKSKKSKLDYSLFIYNVYVFCFSSWICVTLYRLLIFFLIILVNLHARDSIENVEKWWKIIWKHAENSSKPVSLFSKLNFVQITKIS